jgi:hypothetical protein
MAAREYLDAPDWKASAQKIGFLFIPPMQNPAFANTAILFIAEYRIFMYAYCL